MASSFIAAPANYDGPHKTEMDDDAGDGHMDGEPDSSYIDIDIDIVS
jgi:hypothetical protein